VELSQTSPQRPDFKQVKLYKHKAAMRNTLGEQQAWPKLHKTSINRNFTKYHIILSPLRFLPLPEP